MEKKSVSKYTTYYMTIGMSIGMMCGMMLGNFVFDNKMTMGMMWGLSLGMCIGIAFGAAKDKKLSEKMMQISRIEDVPDSTDKLVYAVDKSGEEKEYRVKETRFLAEKFSVGDIVAEDAGELESLESK